MLYGPCDSVLGQSLLESSNTWISHDQEPYREHGDFFKSTITWVPVVGFLS